jgi:hypothetical protein
MTASPAQGGCGVTCRGARRPSCPFKRRRGPTKIRRHRPPHGLSASVTWRMMALSGFKRVWKGTARSCQALLVAAPALAVGGLVAQPPTAGAHPAPGTATSVLPEAACQPHVVLGVIPSWASGGFHPAAYRMYYELGRSDRIVALLWAHPLRSPPSPTYANKILWVSHRPGNGSPLLIRAQRMRGTRNVGKPVLATVPGGPGPSYVDMPSPGCWRLTLTWSGSRDSLDLNYVP